MVPFSLLWPLLNLSRADWMFQLASVVVDVPAGHPHFCSACDGLV